MSLDISGIDKVRLLRALWENSEPARFFTTRTAPAWDEAEARRAVAGPIDYFCGRLIKMDLSEDTADPRLYDRDFGSGAAERIVAAFRELA